MAAPTVAGIDIGATSLRAVEVRLTKNRPMVERFEQVALPAGAVVGGVLKDPKAVTAALKQLKSSKMFANSSAALAVTHQQVVVRDIEVPNLPQAQLRQALPHLAREAVSVAVDEAILDFVPFASEDEQENKGDTVRGLLTAAPREAVVDAVEAVERAGLKVDRVDLACFAVLRAVATAGEGAEAIIDIGANATLFVIHVDGVPKMVRTIPRGANDITATLGRRLNCNLAEAEARKCEFGLLNPIDADYTEAMQDAVRPLVAELRSSIAYFAQGHAVADPVARLTLVGGGSRLRGLGELLANSLDRPVAQGNPLQYVGTSRRGGGHDALGFNRASAAVSVGLTLGVPS